MDLSMADGVGIVALIISVYALMRPTNNGILWIIGVSVSLWGVHYWLLGSTSGAWVHWISALALFFAHAMQSQALALRVAATVGFSTLGVALSVSSDLLLSDLVIAAGCIIMMVSQFLLRGLALRWGFIVGELAFLAFAIMVGSLPGMAVTLLNAGACTLGLVRMYKAKKQLLTLQQQSVL